MPVRVIFTYCEESRKWEPTVEGASDPVEARQAFSAVVITCQQLNADILTRAKSVPIDNHYVITPAVLWDARRN